MQSKKKREMLYKKFNSNLFLTIKKNTIKIHVAVTQSVHIINYEQLPGDTLIINLNRSNLYVTSSVI